MREVSSDNFGLLIAYVLPGLVALVGIGQISPSVQSWLASTPPDAPTVAGFLYLTLTAIGAGLIISAVRWAVLDRLYHILGVNEPAWDFSRFGDRVNAFGALVENHYRYYQFYANTLVALVFTYLIRHGATGFRIGSVSWIDLGYLGIAVVLVIGSRDTLRKYYSRAEALLRGNESRGSVHRQR